MQNQELIDLWERLEYVRVQVLALLENASEEELAFVPAGFNNPACVIGRHLAGVETYWIGQVVGGIDAHRDRPAEFAKPGWPRAKVLEALSKSRDVSQKVFQSLEPAGLDGPIHLLPGFTPPHSPENPTRRFAILHVLEHESYHLGQLSVLLRIVKESGAIL